MLILPNMFRPDSMMVTDGAFRRQDISSHRDHVGGSLNVKDALTYGPYVKFDTYLTKYFFHVQVKSVGI